MRRFATVLVTLSSVALVGACCTPRRRAEEPTPSVEWAFEAQKRGGFLTTPLVGEDRVWIAASHDTAFRNAGAVYCVDRATGKELWRFDDGGKMQHTYSSPCLADGRLYVGEGMHANFVCKLYCLDAATGQKLWDFSAEGHIESSPCAADGRVFFGAGDDGLYCLDARTGEKRWQFSGPFHIDSSPAVRGGRVYAGAGVSRTNRTLEVWCLGAEDGKVRWRYPADLPVWGSPEVSGDDVFFGLGNGRLLTGPEPPEKPAGALLCLSATSGELRWRHDAGDAVFARATAGERHVFFTSRNGGCYCLDRRTGERCWRQDLGSPVLTSPALEGGRLYVAASGGRVSCLDADGGRLRWTFDAGAQSRTEPLFLSSPVARAGRVYFGGELRNPASSAAVLYCLRDDEAKQGTP